ncbi:hypothetical protein [Planctopirus hydrillae]|uniref:STAS/SEC14 domain-containing protein n=1 Tax=Planctopirus hydrillae TaxID=1841610 RepID=A0A1C3E5G0_9PLAN|nr:hypothetical protein [Planctopirus hydrillae]ODA28474.1 hypothetical protein A6X21_12200 [Planctopirus hydrillae]
MRSSQPVKKHIQLHTFVAANAKHMIAKEFKPSKIEFAAIVYELGEVGDEFEVVAIKFMGEYGYGSAGNGDAAYMIAIRDYIVTCVLPSALIFDLRELEYEWGSAIWDMFRCDEPFATIVSERCNGFLTCGVAKPMFDDVDAALDYLRPRAIQYRTSLSE